MLAFHRLRALPKPPFRLRVGAISTILALSAPCAPADAQPKRDAPTVSVGCSTTFEQPWNTSNRQRDRRLPTTYLTYGGQAIGVFSGVSRGYPQVGIEILGSRSGSLLPELPLGDFRAWLCEAIDSLLLGAQASRQPGSRPLNPYPLMDFTRDIGFVVFRATRGTARDEVYVLAILPLRDEENGAYLPLSRAELFSLLRVLARHADAADRMAAVPGSAARGPTAVEAVSRLP